MSWFPYRSLIGLIAWVLWTSTCTNSYAEDRLPTELNNATVQQLIEELTPDESQLWRTIPWKISMLDGQKEASLQKKPIFVWAMDGHPLGCT